MKKVMPLAALVLALGACDRTHMSPHFGEANRQAFRSQVIYPDAGGGNKPDQPLDPEEAAIVAHTYLKSLAPPNAQDNAADRNRILVVPAPQPGGVGMPAPGTGQAR